ncbi:MAG: hypothetical protein CMC05_11990 [Flavobacteriaceae bacterium]|mgnify:CR=1 FL=1|uniref:hypothetical protein n=1 Tax=Winogradskyella poriferorum TaxID=307627 RepID=UPI000C520E6F|nr:hypothetical protein [Flavobacteriaceae bacterium]MBD10776.1 hypothetical protein [Flavobacteriaceae bacterium]|tara:strand:+ start:169 stop:540 length:372 start_codon:yes stop_codon:yes gene_type:complete
MKDYIEKRICPYCGVEFVPKRSNQIFNNSVCRIAYNNKRNNAKRKELAKLFKPIEKQYEILLSLLNANKEVDVHREFLRGAGFNFSLFTHIHFNESIKMNCYALHTVHYYKINQDYYKICNNG